MIRKISAPLSIFLLVISTALPATAQTYMFQNVPKGEPQIGVRYLRPDVDMTFFSGIYDFSVNLPISGCWSAAGSIPFTTVADPDEDESESGLGNLFIGIQHMGRSGERGSMVHSLGAYLPTAKDDLGLTIFGVFTNEEQMGKYLQDYLTLYYNFAYFYESAHSTRFGLEFGPEMMVYTGEGGGDHEIFVHYGLAGGIALDYLSLMAELYGVGILSETVNSFTDRFEHSITFGASFIGGNVAPGVFYKIYLEDENRDIVGGVFGINLEMTF